MELEDINDIDDDCGCSGELKKKKKVFLLDVRFVFESGVFEFFYSD